MAFVTVERSFLSRAPGDTDLVKRDWLATRRRAEVSAGWRIRERAGYRGCGRERPRSAPRTSRAATRPKPSTTGQSPMLRSTASPLAGPIRAGVADARPIQGRLHEDRDDTGLHTTLQTFGNRLG